jgi:glycosyltransferase involved in cell wall biosynthesis
MKNTFFLDQGETLGGAERFLLDFFSSLNRAEIRRLHPMVVGGQAEAYKNLLPTEIEIVDFQFPSVRGGPLRKIIACIKIFSAARKLAQTVRKHNATRIFSNTPRTHFVMLLAQKIFGVQSLWVAYFHDFTTRPNFLLRNICKNADFLLVNALPTRKFLRDRIPEYLYEKIKIVENGLDFSVIPAPQPAQKIEKILCLGRLDPRKGQKFFVETAAILQKTNPDLYFFIVGDSFEQDPRTTQYEREIKTFAAENKLHNVHFLPGVPDPFPVIQEADMLVVLPTEPETFGRVVIEALACGKLVLAFDETGPREILQQYESFLRTQKIPLPIALRVEKQNPHALAEKIKFFAEHPDTVPPLTTQARAFVEKNFSLSDTKKRLLNVILEAY